MISDKKIFLLGGAFLVLLLLSMSCVSAADDNSQVVCDNNTLNVEINKTNREIDTNISYNASNIVLNE